MRLALLDYQDGVLTEHAEGEFRAALSAAFARRIRPGRFQNADATRTKLLADLEASLDEVEQEFRRRSVGF
jgi:hypothetical protein